MSVLPPGPPNPPRHLLEAAERDARFSQLRGADAGHVIPEPTPLSVLLLGDWQLSDGDRVQVGCRSGGVVHGVVRAQLCTGVALAVDSEPDSVDDDGLRMIAWNALEVVNVRRAGS